MRGNSEEIMVASVWFVAFAALVLFAIVKVVKWMWYV